MGVEKVDAVFGGWWRGLNRGGSDPGDGEIRCGHMLREMSVEGDTEVGRAPEVRSVNEKVGKSGGFRRA